MIFKISPKFWDLKTCYRYFEKLMPLCLALFFARTVFIGYKYLFLGIFVLCAAGSGYSFFVKKNSTPKFTVFVLPILVVMLYVAHLATYSMVLKELANLCFIIYFLCFNKSNSIEETQISFFKWLIYLVESAGVIAILRWGFSLVGVTLPLGSVLFEGNGFSLVNDGNFYSLFFIIAIVTSVRLLRCGQLKLSMTLLFNFISIVNIVFCMSRRAYMLYALVIVALIVLAVFKRNEYKNVLEFNLLFLFLLGCGVGIAIVYSEKIYTPESPYNKKNRLYKLYSLVDNGKSLMEFDILQQKKYYYECQPNDSNLFYNGDLLAGMKCWRTDHREPINVSWHNDESEPFIRIEKVHSARWWSLIYSGRPIFYKAGVEYTYCFKYRLIQGNGVPFRVGLWVKESRGYIEDLKKEILPFDSVWNICVVRHVFEKDQMNPTCFLNCQQPNTIIDVKDIRLTSDDTSGLPCYVDQLPDSVIHKYYSKDTINYFTASRTDRWRYALELWQTRYNTKQKIFGRGFKYLEWYGEKFLGNPKRYDFPHNPIISSFLYSGIIGGVVYIIFLIMSLWLYWKKRQQLGIFFIMYLCCMFFSMFSGSSHFSFPLFAFLSFLPFVEYKSDVDAEKVNVIQG